MPCPESFQRRRAENIRCSPQGRSDSVGKNAKTVRPACSMGSTTNTHNSKGSHPNAPTHNKAEIRTSVAWGGAGLYGLCVIIRMVSTYHKPIPLNRRICAVETCRLIPYLFLSCLFWELQSGEPFFLNTLFWQVPNRPFGRIAYATLISCQRCGQSLHVEIFQARVCQQVPSWICLLLTLALEPYVLSTVAPCL